MFLPQSKFLLCVRYVGVDSDEEMCVKESFLGFAEASSTTVEELATTIMTKLREYGIVTQAMRGQGYDGAANMAGKFSGVRTCIQPKFLKPIMSTAMHIA